MFKVIKHEGVSLPAWKESDRVVLVALVPGASRGVIVGERFGVKAADAVKLIASKHAKLDPEAAEACGLNANATAEAVLPPGPKTEDVTPPKHVVPTLSDVLAAGYAEDVAHGIVARETVLAAGGTDGDADVAFQAAKVAFQASNPPKVDDEKKGDDKPPAEDTVSTSKKNATPRPRS